MCGRFTLTNPDPAQLRARFELGEPAGLAGAEQPRFNIAPTDPVLAIRRAGEGARELGRLRWGLLPGRWAERRSGGPLINARAESLARQPAFAESFRERRCLIPADGFYEWRQADDGKVPVWIARADGELFAFAGIWAELRRGDGEPVHSCAIVTTAPSSQIRPIHDRMPVVMAREAEAAWLDPDAGQDELLELLAPTPDGALAVREVSDAVNDVREDGPHLIAARAAGSAQGQEQLF